MGAEINPPVAVLGGLGCTQLASLVATAPFTGFFPFPIASGTGLGTTVYAQAWALTATEVRTTNAVEFIVGL